MNGYDRRNRISRFIEIPKAPTKNPKSETATSTPDNIGQSTKKRRQVVNFQKPLHTSSSVGAAAGTATNSSMVIPGPQIPKPARPLSPAEREDSIPKRHGPTEVNTVLALAGGDSRIEISTLMKNQKALHSRPSIHDATGIVNCYDRRNRISGAAQGLERFGQATVVRWKRCRVPKLSIHLQNHRSVVRLVSQQLMNRCEVERNPFFPDSRESAGKCTPEVLHTDV